MSSLSDIADTDAMDPYCGPGVDPGSGVISEEGIREFVRSYAMTVYHPVGTCKMGNDKHAVVEELRVHGVDGLRVVDASVMPRIVGGNTNAPTIAIAEKAAGLIPN